MHFFRKTGNRSNKGRGIARDNCIYMRCPLVCISLKAYQSPRKRSHKRHRFFVHGAELPEYGKCAGKICVK